jgi:HD domain
MPEIIADVVVPDTALVSDATSIARDATDDTVFDHSRRVYFWGSLKARALGLELDPELAYVGAMFHDLGLTQKYRTVDRRFEIDGAEAAKSFLLSHGRNAADAEKVWLAIALHTTPEVPMGLAPEVAVVTLGVETDVLGFELEAITSADRDAVLAAHPRPDFKNRILRAFNDAMKDRPKTTFGTMNDDVLAHFDPGFTRANFVDIIRSNAWPE